MIQNLVATNRKGLSISFDSSFRLTSGLDLSGLPAEVNSTQTTQAGSRYQNTRLTNRDLDLEFQIRRQFSDETLMDSKRSQMYLVFSPEAGPVRFTFNLSDGTEYYFEAYTLAAPVMPPDKENNNSAFQLALVQMRCTDPYIYKSVMNNTDIALFNGGFIFPLEIPEGVGIELGVRSESLSANIYNDGTGDIGAIIKFKALANLTNPRITNVDTYETLGLNFSMIAGDEITINTSKGKRSVMLKRDNITTNIFNSFDFLGSTFFQLHQGSNIIRYDATTGLDNLQVSIQYNDRYVGV